MRGDVRVGSALGRRVVGRQSAHGNELDSGPTSTAPSTQASTPTADQMLLERAQQIEALRQQVEQARRALLDLQTKMQDAERHHDQALQVAVNAARDAGHGEGLKQALVDERARCAALEAAATRAFTAYDGALEELGALATPLACTAVERVLGPAATDPTQIANAIAEQLRRLRDVGAVAVHVSPFDFGDGSSLQEVLDAGGRSVRAVIDNSLTQGEVVLQLQLGTIEAGIRQQLGALRAALQGDDDAA